MRPASGTRDTLVSSAAGFPVFEPSVSVADVPAPPAHVDASHGVLLAGHPVHPEHLSAEQVCPVTSHNDLNTEQNQSVSNIRIKAGNL